jgi:hypothetical protein
LPNAGLPIGVAIDIMDEAHSLRLALYRLAVDAALRARLGRAAREHWRTRHTVAHMVADLVRAIDRAVAEPAPPRVRRTDARAGPLSAEA